jgi:hypothetical protein
LDRDVTVNPPGTPHPQETVMRHTLVWLIEQACRLGDARVCAIANLTDDTESASGAWPGN